MKTALFLLVYTVSFYFGAIAYADLYQKIEYAQMQKSFAAGQADVLMSELRIAIAVKDACVDALTTCVRGDGGTP